MKIAEFDTDTPIHIALIALKLYLERSNTQFVAISQNLLENNSTLEILHEYDSDTQINVITFKNKNDDLAKKKEMLHDVLIEFKLKMQEPPTGTLQ